MKKLPKTWFVDISKESDLALKAKFIKWFNENADNPTCGTMCKYHGSWRGELDFWSIKSHEKDVISLNEWNDCVFGKEETFEKGEEVLVRDNGDDKWINGIFITEYKNIYIVETNEMVFEYDQCKKKPSELDIKIEELKKFAEEKGLKLTVIVE